MQISCHWDKGYPEDRTREDGLRSVTTSYDSGFGIGSREMLVTVDPTTVTLGCDVSVT